MPVLWIVIDVDKFYPELLTVLLVLFLPNLKLLPGVDVGIVVEYNTSSNAGEEIISCIMAPEHGVQRLIWRRTQGDAG